MTDSLPKERLEELDALVRAAQGSHHADIGCLAMPTREDSTLARALDPDTVRALIAMARQAEKIREQHANLSREYPLECNRRVKAEAKLERVREILANEPDECPEHPDDDVISCGWKGDIIQIREIIYGEQD